MPKALPVRRLQLPQWQTPWITGSPATVIEMVRQAQVAVLILGCIAGARGRRDAQSSRSRPGPCNSQRARVTASVQKSVNSARTLPTAILAAATAPAGFSLGVGATA